MDEEVTEVASHMADTMVDRVDTVAPYLTNPWDKPLSDDGRTSSPASQISSLREPSPVLLPQKERNKRKRPATSELDDRPRKLNSSSIQEAEDQNSTVDLRQIKSVPPELEHIVLNEFHKLPGGVRDSTCHEFIDSLVHRRPFVTSVRSSVNASLAPIADALPASSKTSTEAASIRTSSAMQFTRARSRNLNALVARSKITPRSRCDFALVTI
jgi:hypothetical protein